MYFFSGLQKLLEESWPNGSALADSLSGPYALDLGLWLAGWMPLIGYKIMSLGTIGFGNKQCLVVDSPLDCCRFRMLHGTGSGTSALSLGWAHVGW